MSADVAPPSAAVPPRSAFVTVVAWIFIVGTGVGVCVSILQAIMFVFIVPTEAFWSASNMSLDPDQTPAIVLFIAGHMLLVFGVLWSIAVVTLIAAIGLLRRKNWARLAFIGLMGLAILCNFGGLWLEAEIFSSSALSAIGLSVLFAWIIKRLASRTAGAEFDAL
ncbi:MAG: hypothetical protein ABI569_01575 [Casimicrobiaceae bacterium]